MRRAFIIINLLYLAFPSRAAVIRQMEFVNKPVKDILFTLTGVTESSIIPDDTVHGSASYYFVNTELEPALRNFLKSCNLYLTKTNGIYHVSAIFTEYDKEKNILTVKARDTETRAIIDRISETIGKTVIRGTLPSGRITINAVNMPPEKVLEIITAKFSNYTVVNKGTYFLIKRNPDTVNAMHQRKSGADVKKENGLYSINAVSADFTETIAELFSISGFEYSLLKKSDPLIRNMHFKSKTFDELLQLIMEQTGSGFSVKNNIYYIFDVSKNEIRKKLDNREYIKLRKLPAGIILSLMPSGLAGSSNIKIDKANNAVIISGSKEETAPVRDFILNLEKEYDLKEIKRIDLSFIKADELVKILPEGLRTMKITKLGNPYSIIVEAGKERINDLEEFIKLTDIRTDSFAIPLRFIRSSDIMKNMPPSADSSEIIRAADPNMIFFKGSAEKLKQFRNNLAFIDKPVPQIRYELLVVQYQHSNGSDYSLSAEAETVQPETETSFIGSIGNLLNLNLDIVSSFGYQFAVDLNAKLNESKARVMADTTLNGLTGEDISFRNTNTYRYRDMEIDPDTGKEISTGITREITSGLIININGWVSGDNMITMNVKSTVSKRGADVSSKSTNPPPTSEKIINTHVRTESGQPVVIGGLFQQEKDISIQKIPLLSGIPFLGRIFTSRIETFENTELVIYIIPRIEYPDKNKMSMEESMERYYTIFFSKKEP